MAIEHLSQRGNHDRENHAQKRQAGEGSGQAKAAIESGHRRFHRPIPIMTSRPVAIIARLVLIQPQCPAQYRLEDRGLAHESEVARMGAVGGAFVVIAIEAISRNVK
jgi:hypothetical protein